MKRFLSIVLLTFISVAFLAGCAPDVPRPEVREGRFNISVTYEQDGEVKEASVVYVCEYKGIAWTLEAQPYVNWKESFEGDIKDDGLIPICNTDDGGEIFISLLLYPEYFMGDPNYAEYTPIVRAELFYDDEQTDDAEIIAEYGVKLIGFEYDEPIENAFS